jgi:MoaA/NifB/PqqE/SkfB family radical SAM enzyme
MKNAILKSLLAPRSVAHFILHVTNRCPLRCKTCFVDKDTVAGEELSREEIRDIAREFNKLVWLDISGGEPFLRDDLPDICALFKAASIGIPTNAFDPGLIAGMARQIRNKVNAEINISVSIDGFEAVNDDVRGKGCFEKSLKTVALLKRIKGIRVKVNTVLCNLTYPDIIKFMAFVRTLGVDFHSIIFRRGDPSSSEEYDCPCYNDLNRIKEDVFRMWSGYDYGFGNFQRMLLRNYQRALYNFSLRVIKEGVQSPGCLAGRRHLVVYANGDVSFCEMLHPFGNLRARPLSKLLSSHEAEAVRKSIIRRECRCYHNCNMLDNFFLNITQYPKLFIPLR